ncbi:MAG: hypothetical protein MMC23_000264 [Stictis urceolatum]|nr:hypothetical protein [Stictis urceolata]
MKQHSHSPQPSSTSDYTFGTEIDHSTLSDKSTRPLIMPTSSAQNGPAGYIHTGIGGFGNYRRCAPGSILPYDAHNDISLRNLCRGCQSTTLDLSGAHSRRGSRRYGIGGAGNVCSNQQNHADCKSRSNENERVETEGDDKTTAPGNLYRKKASQGKQDSKTNTRGVADVWGTRLKRALGCSSGEFEDHGKKP